MMQNFFNELGFEIELNDAVKNVLMKARRLALAYNHDLCTTDHILYNLLEEENIIKLLEKTGTSQKDLENIRENIDELIRKNIKPNKNQLTNLPKFSISFLPFSILEQIKQKNYEIPLTENNRKFYKIDEYELLSILINNKIIEISMSVKYFVSKIDLKKLIIELNQINTNQNLNNSSEKKYLNVILSFCEDVNQKQKELDEQIVGRKKEIQIISKILMRKKKNNVLMIGEPGVGKTAIIQKLAQEINKKTINQKLWNFNIFSLNLESLISGAFLRGELENRIQMLFESLKEYTKTNNKNVILVIDEFHMIVGMGISDQNKTNDLSNILKKYFDDPEIKFIGSTTSREYHNNIEKDKALNRRFYKLIVHEPSREETLEILKDVIPSYEKHHRVKYSLNALKAAIDLTSKFIINERLPDKAIDILDITGAHVKLNENNGKVITITSDMVKKQFAEINNISLDVLAFENENRDENLNSLMMNLENNLKKYIYGQDEAIQEIVDQLIISRAGLNNPEKPLCSFLLNGPTGTGKTELCKKISEQFGIKMFRLDMSEYMEENSVSKLLGAAPGYIGYDNGSKLTDWVSQNPNSLILFDEIEKAHPKVLNVLLQILDYGKLTNSKNVTVDFKQTMIFMTSNIGSRIKSIKLGFGNEQNLDEDQLEEINKIIPPELRNRFDGIILFKPLTEETCFKIIDKFFNQLNEQLKNKNISVTIDNNLRSYLLKVGFDAQLGARPLERIINKKIKKLLARNLITGEIKNNQDILLNYENNEIRMNILYKKDIPLMDSNINTEEEKENILYRIFKYFK